MHSKLKFLFINALYIVVYASGILKTIVYQRYYIPDVFLIRTS